MKYIGVKVTDATPSTLGDYNRFKGWIIPENEDPATEGYRVTYKDGYISWSPKEAFEESHRPFEGMPFGYALEAMREGLKVARKGWNGKGMYIQLVPKGFYDVGCSIAEGLNLLPWIGMKTADSGFVPWLASQTDVLAEDWCVIE